MSQEGKIALNEEEALELLAYLLASTQGLFEEPGDYGIYRMVTAAERLARMWAPRATGSLGAYLRDLADRTPNEAAQMSVDMDRFFDYLTSQVRTLAQEVKRREPGDDSGNGS